MRTDFSGLTVSARTRDEIKAAKIFAREIYLRTGITPEITEKEENSPSVIFREENIENDSFRLSLKKNVLTVYAKGIRGFIYGGGYFLRKSAYKEYNVTLITDITGSYAPDKKIRGHQLGYRPCNNTYDAWGPEQYYRYYLDLMYFGMNTCEHVPYEKGRSEKNEIMQYDEEELLIKAADAADELDLDVSLWYPNSEDDIETAKTNRDRVFSSCKRINACFPPGGDPGSLMPDELISRCTQFREILRKYHPDAVMFPSAQTPHEYPDWGEKFAEEMDKHPSGIDGVITGPNRAFPLDALRRLLPPEYPIRLYPDITHNVRCEYPVHFDRDDWHYAFAATLGRECINPRPSEYRTIHTLTSRYTIGSVTYSEGVNDDINKAVWCALEYNPRTPLREILCDYSRLYFIGADENKVCDAILGLEQNWLGSPEENSCIEHTLSLWQKIGKETPSLRENWRYLSCLFRAECDAFIRRKMIFEHALIERACYHIERNYLKKAERILRMPFDAGITYLRDDIEINAGRLYELIGMQLGTVLYHASGWERGAVLDTIDRPITDRQWLLNKFEQTADMDDAHACAFIKRAVGRNRVESDEYYFSLALNGLDALGTKQTDDFYMDFQGDRPSQSDAKLPMCMVKLFDHYNFSFRLGGFIPGRDYILTVTYKDSPAAAAQHHKVSVNGTVIYDGPQFGGTRNTLYEKEMLPEGFTAVQYKIPADIFVNGCIEVEISESEAGFEVGEFRITKMPYGEERTESE